MDKAAKQDVQVELVTHRSNKEEKDDDDLDIGDLDLDDNIMLSDDETSPPPTKEKTCPLQSPNL